MADLYFFLLELPFYYASSNEALLFITAVALLVTLLPRFASHLPGTAGKVAGSALGNLVALPALMAQAYLLVFALRTQAVYTAALIAAGAAGVWLLARSAPDPLGRKPRLDDAPLPMVAFLVGCYLFLGLVMGHLATPVVHWIATYMAALSARAWYLQHLLVALLLLAPVGLWLPALSRGPVGTGRQAMLGTAATLVFSVVPGAAGIYMAGVTAAITVVLAAAAAGLLPTRSVHPSPRAVAAQLLLISLLALNAITVHYGAVMWRCPGPQEGVRRVSDWPGTFDLGPLAGGTRLLVSLREPRRIAELDLATGQPLWVADSGKLMDGTGHLFSWVEPETILPLADGESALLLLAVSDDEEANRVVKVVSGKGVAGFLDDLPRTSISDLVDDGKGAPLVSTEFDGDVISLDPTTLAVRDRVRWPDAETNKILAAPGGARIFSLGLWNDPFLRVMDRATGAETAALEVGTRSWDMALDPVRGRLYVPRLVDGELLVVDADGLTLLERRSLRFGARPVALDAAQRRLLVGNMYHGTVRIFDLDRDEQLARLRLGGYIKGLAVDEDTHKAYTGCACGIYEIDLEAF